MILNMTSFEEATHTIKFLIDNQVKITCSQSVEDLVLSDNSKLNSDGNNLKHKRSE